MKLTVYHTTSSIFLRSIKEHGLMGVDIRQKLPNLSIAMKEMIDRLDHYYSSYGTDWGENPGFRGNCQRMANTEYKNQSGMDYEYGNAYVTPSRIRIAIYNSYEFGSELLTYFFRLYRCLYQKHEDKTKAEFDAKYPELIKIIGIKNKKNLILKAEVDTSDLLNDSTGKRLGEDEIELIQLMQKVCNGDVQLSYRIARTLNPDEIEVLTLDRERITSFGLLSDFEIPDIWEQLGT